MADVSGKLVNGILRVSPWAGGVVWILSIAMNGADPYVHNWAAQLILLAVLVHVPLVLRILKPRFNDGLAGRALALAVLIHPVAALTLLVSLQLPQGSLAAGFALPWLAVAGLLSVAAGLRLAAGRSFSPSLLVETAGLVYISVGAGWTLMDRMAIHPMGFSTVIVLLTATHFHYAGLILPIVTSRVAAHSPGRWSTVACIGVILGIPGVAVGITASQLGMGPLLELCGTWLAVLSALIVAGIQIKLAARESNQPIAWLWYVSAASLIAAMILAASYGSRYFVSWPDLNIPYMRAIHGSANALGFSLLALTGWVLKGKRTEYAQQSQPTMSSVVTVVNSAPPLPKG